MSAEILYAIQPGPHWDWKVALDLFFGGAGVGALMFAVWIDERFNVKYKHIGHTAAVLAPVFIALGLVLVMMKMGRPLHLYKVYLNVNLVSPLWWGGIFQPLLLVGSLMYARRWVHPVETDTFRKTLGRLLVPLALVVGTYHGLLLAINVSQPLWNAEPAVVSALLGFATTGIAAVMLVHLIRMKAAGRLANEQRVSEFLADMRPIRNTLFVLLTMQLFTYFMWWLSLVYGTLQNQQALMAANESYGPLFWGMSVGLGVIFPLAFGSYSVLRGQAWKCPLQVTTIAITSTCILIGGVCFRLALVLGGQAEIPPGIF